jgi:hypothetical protein
MTNINKKKVLADFIAKESIVSRILLENRKIFDYKIKENKTTET